MSLTMEASASKSLPNMSTGSTQLTPLSPSRASDFKACPQLFKFRVIDRLPEPPDAAGARGTLVHNVLERLYRLPCAERTAACARDLLGEAWQELQESPEFPELAVGLGEAAEWLAGAEHLLANYFLVEDPRRVQVHEVEWWVEHETERTLLRGIIDRVQVLPGGEWTLVDYKTGASPSETYAFGKFFGLRFYALVCWRAFGKLPTELRLLHLREPVVVSLVPTVRMLEGLERQLDALGAAIRRAHEHDDWRPRRGTLCSWCPHKALCPAWAEAGALEVLAAGAAPGA
jgi:putative RecB family exonuclease